MRVIIIGCEYSGTTTLGYNISRWGTETMGEGFGLVHDHWKIPHVINHPSDMTEKEQQDYLSLSTRVKEAAQRHNLYYHTPSSRDTDGIVVGYYFEDTIYGDLYYSYGGDGQPGDRKVHSKKIEELNIEFAPETVLVLTKAKSEVIQARMSNTPHDKQIITSQDIDLVLNRFEDAYLASGIRQKITIDNSDLSADESLEDFVSQVKPYLTQRDRSRM